MSSSIHLDAQGLFEILTEEETSLLHPDYFGLRLEEEFKKSWRYGWAYTLIVFEIEGIEAIRAKDGDVAYRGLLLAVAGEILNASRDIDLSTRQEDGRFVVLLPGCDREGAEAFVKRVLTDNVLERAQGRFTLSVGGTCSPDPQMDSVDEFVARADTAVSRAREMGPNRFVVWNQASA